jgi:hypothetical protein
LNEVPGRDRVTVGADKAYDTASFVAEMRAMNRPVAKVGRPALRFGGFSPVTLPLRDQNGPKPSSRFTSPATIEILV